MLFIMAVAGEATEYEQHTDIFITVLSNPSQADLRHYCWRQQSVQPRRHLTSVKKLSKLPSTIKFIFSALKKRGRCVSGVGDVSLQPCSVLLPQSFPFSCKLCIAITVWGNNNFWVAFVYMSHTNPEVS